MTIDVTHPLIDGAGDGWAATELHCDVVGLGAAMSDFLHRTTIEGTTPVIVTGRYARLTEPLLGTLTAVRGRWLVRTGPQRFYDARTGAVATSVSEALAQPPITADTPLATEFAARPIAAGLRLVTYAITRHRTTRPVRLGGVMESMCAGCTGGSSAGWGPTEPVAAVWNRDELTELSRRRMPHGSRWMTVGPDPASFIGTIEVTRTKEGIEETTRTSADRGAPGGARHATIAADALRLLHGAAAFGMPLIGVALAHASNADLTRSPVAESPPQPLALLIGPAGVRMIGVDIGVWIEMFGARRLGSPRMPSVLFALGGTDGGGWERLRDILSVPDEQVLQAALGVSPELADLARSAAAATGRTGGGDA